MLNDLSYGFQMMAKNLGFTAGAVLSLALGIGANTAIFSLINAVMLKMLPVKQPEHLVLLNWAAQAWPAMIPSLRGTISRDKSGRVISTSFTYRTFEEIHTSNNVLSGMCAFAGAGRLNLVVNGQPGLAESELVSGDYFSTLGIQPVLGRLLTPQDDQANASPAAVISYGYWMRRFGGDPAVVGKNATVNGIPFTIVGVSPAEFFGVEPGRSIDVWIPLQTEPEVQRGWFEARTNWWLLIMGRLKPGVRKQEALANLEVLFRQSITAGTNRPIQAEGLPHLELSSGSQGVDSVRRQFSRPLLTLMAVVGLVLLIACANVANLLLARATARQKEIAVRLALGAARWRVIRQLLTESVLLSTSGGILGLLLAFWATDLIIAFMSSGGQQIGLHVSPDPHVLGFTAIVAVVTGILFGLAPALRGTRLDLTRALKDSAGSMFGGVRRIGGLHLGLGKALVVSQVAVSLLLLIGAGLFVRTLENLQKENLGFDRRNLLLFGIDPTQNGYKGQRLVRFYEELQRRLQAIAGVRSASLSQRAPLSGGVSVVGLVVQGYTPKPNADRNDGSFDVHVNVVSPGFFETMGIPLLVGRPINTGDNATSPMVGVVNEAFVRTYLETQNPIGSRAAWAGEPSRKMEIVGVVSDARYDKLRREAPPTYYVPYTQFEDPHTQSEERLGPMYFEVRTTGNPRDWIASVRNVVQELDRVTPIFDVKTQIEQINESIFQERLFAKLSSFFGLLALLLACVGLYGIMSYAVVGRTNEIGIRMALGAEQVSILRCVLREALLLVGFGIVLGIPLALAATRLIASELYGFKPNDPITISLAVSLMTAVVALAGYLSACKASPVDSMMTL